MEGDVRLAHRIPAGLTPAAAGRRFGLTVGLAFVVFAGIAFWREHPLAARILVTPGALLLMAAAVIPTALGPVERAWMGFALLLSKVTTPIFMGAVYFLVLTPIGVVRRLAGANSVAVPPKQPSFWAPRDAARSDLHRQF